ncbi:hypothetical protein Tco_0911827 [Tanacetum coccineum]
MKHWKRGFFFINQRAIPDYMSWRHPSLAIDDPRPPAGSFNMDDVCWLSAHVVKLRDIPEGFLVLSGLILMGIHDFLCLPEWTGDEVQEEPHHDIRPTFAKVIDTAEASQKQKASTFGAASSHVSKHTRSALAQLSGNTTRPNFFVDNSGEESDDDDDACPSTRDSQGKDIMTDAAVASSVGVSYPWSSFRPAPSLREVSGDAIHRDFFPFLLDHIMPHIPKVELSGIIKALTNDQMNEKMSVLHYLMMSRDGELLAQYHGLLQSYHEYVQSTDSSFAKSKSQREERKKNIKSFTKSLDQLNAEVASLSTTLNQATVLKAEKDEEILRLKASPSEFVSLFQGAGFELGLSMHRTKEEFAAVMKEISQFVPGAQDRLAEASSLIAQTDYAFLNKIFEHAAEPLSVILQLEPAKLTRPTNVPASRGTSCFSSCYKGVNCDTCFLILGVAL